MKSPVEGWTDARFKNWIISLLRKGTLRFPNRTACLQAAKTEKKINEKSGRLAQHYKCASCNKDWAMSNVVVDHKEPVVPVDQGFTTFDEYIGRMFCTKDNMQVLCKDCHTDKSSKESEQRKEYRQKLKGKK